ncbi:MAG: hypothetical protein JWM43_3255 [Acidobacteriaceae bacterium]|nr:hypothetical protein [Acidobacteriaceae bacterium]
MEVDDLLRKLESDLLEPSNRSDSRFLDLVVADEFREFGSSGRLFDKASLIQALLNESLHEKIVLSEFAVQALGAEASLVTYRSTRQASSELPQQSVRRSSIWIKREGRWQLIFHQGTLIPTVG